MQIVIYVPFWPVVVIGILVLGESALNVVFCSGRCHLLPRFGMSWWKSQLALTALSHFQWNQWLHSHKSETVIAFIILFEKPEGTGSQLLSSQVTHLHELLCWHCWSQCGMDPLCPQMLWCSTGEWQICHMCSMRRGTHLHNGRVESYPLDTSTHPSKHCAVKTSSVQHSPTLNDLMCLPTTKLGWPIWHKPFWILFCSLQGCHRKQGRIKLLTHLQHWLLFLFFLGYPLMSAATGARFDIEGKTWLWQICILFSVSPKQKDLGEEVGHKLIGCSEETHFTLVLSVIEISAKKRPWVGWTQKN